jgi:MFS family permease
LVLCAISPNVWIFALAVVVMEVAACMVLYEAAFAALTQVYGHDARSRITAVTLIAGFASTIFWPVTQWLEIKFGWRATYVAFAVLNLIPCLLLHATYLRRARAIPEQPASSVLDVRETAVLSGATRTRAIAWYAAAICASSIVYSALPLHMITAIRSAGFNEHSAALVAMIMGPSQVLARITEILLGDRCDAITTGRISLLALPISLLALLLAQYWGAAAFFFAATYGVSQGLISIARGTVPLQLFGVKGYATLVGRITGLRFYINAGGPFAFAFVATQYGMTLAIVGCLIASLIAGAAFLMLPKSR